MANVKDETIPDSGNKDPLDDIMSEFWDEMQHHKGMEKKDDHHVTMPTGSTDVTTVHINNDDVEEVEENPETDLEISDDDVEYDLEGEDLYLAACKKYRVVPVSLFKHQVNSSDIKLSLLSLEEKDITPICITLARSEFITSLCLSGNCLGIGGLKIIMKMLKVNFGLVELDISSNKLRSEGAHLLETELDRVEHIKKLNISDNEFVESDAEHIGGIFRNCTSLEHLIVSNNSFSGSSGIAIATGIVDNFNLVTLDISRNNIRTSGAVAVARAFKENGNLERVDLSWNGLSDEGARALGEALVSNASLLSIDLSWNRIGIVGAIELAKGLAVNESLQELCLSHNPLTTKGAEALAVFVRKNENSKLKRLDLQSSSLTYESVALLGELETPPLLRFDSFVRCHDQSTRQCNSGGAEAKSEPLRVLEVYTRTNHIDLLTQIRNWLVLKNAGSTEQIEGQDLKMLIRRLPIPMEDGKIDKLVDSMELNENRMIDLSIIESLLKFPTTLKYEVGI